MQMRQSSCLVCHTSIRQFVRIVTTQTGTQLEMTLEIQQQVLDDGVAALRSMGHTIELPEILPMPTELVPESAVAPLAPPESAVAQVAAPVAAQVAAPAPAADAKLFTFLVESDDLFAPGEKKKCSVTAGSMDQLELAIARELNINEAIYVLAHDEDFDEYYVPDSLADVPDKGRVKVKAKAKATSSSIFFRI
eukprot:SAG11_NODE_4495_length_1875_cov_0.964527_3_plen_193_part_00